ncbi:hypothetical protein MPC4_160070 [Methylocella tundrae]|uniref:Uncharacterized protein n=1 Tax=Methylocella tundrae TaxID=227605 RepID=A0A8B6M526_METTU|nr:hypothetical protein MPC1_2870004 [Methylocella tundrae]VTZ49420.1 hypothetical protein MPC4_160070 [Methylocella tundrae]
MISFNMADSGFDQGAAAKRIQIKALAFGLGSRSKRRASAPQPFRGDKTLVPRLTEGEGWGSVSRACEKRVGISVQGWISR